jgi:copper chaperone CopZ
MKGKIKIISMMLFVMLAGNAYDLPVQDDSKKEKKTEEVVFLTDIFCDNCKKKIEKNISWEKGVKDLEVNLEKKTVKILYDPQKTDREKLQKAIEKLGYSCEINEADRTKKGNG